MNILLDREVFLRLFFFFERVLLPAECLLPRVEKRMAWTRPFFVEEQADLLMFEADSNSGSSIPSSCLSCSTLCSLLIRNSTEGLLPSLEKTSGFSDF